MADPVSITGLALAIPPIIKLLVGYASDVKDAKRDAQRYISELLSLKGILEHIALIRGNAVTPTDKFDSKEFSNMVHTTGEALDGLRKALEPKDSRIRSSLQRVTWTFKKKEVEEDIGQLERAKTWFIMVTTTDNLVVSQDILSEVSRFSQVVQVDRKAQQEKRLANKKSELLQWLAPVSPRPAQLGALRAHCHGTGTWFENGPFDDLLKAFGGQSTLLWLQGKSGSGKTTLFAHTVATLNTRVTGTDKEALAYFYCSFDDLASQDPVNILGSVAAQLSSKFPEILDEFADQFEVSTRQKQPKDISVKELKDAIMQHSKGLDQFFLCVDAVNESQHGSVVGEMLLGLARGCPNLKLILTSTAGRGDDPPPDGVEVIDVHMQTRTIDEDISLYIDTRLIEDKNFRDLSDELKNEVKATILLNADGMFRYAQLQMDHLAKALTGRDVRRALQNHPRDLYEIYEWILQKSGPESPYFKYMQRALLWLAFTIRPLTLQELSEAIVIEDDDEDLDSDSRLRSPEALLELSQGLVDYDRETEVVTLAHSSVKAFLTSERIRSNEVSAFALDESTAWKTILHTCLVYLSFGAFGSRKNLRDRDTIIAQYPLFPYAAYNWPFYAKNVDATDWKKINSFLSSQSQFLAGNYGSWITFIIGHLSRSTIKRTEPLYYASSLGYTHLVQAILDFGNSHLEVPGGRAGSTALQVACFRKQRAAALLLVQAGADPISLDGSDLGGGCSSLFWARENGWDDIVQLMEESISKRGFKEQAPVVASQLNDPDVALMLQKRALDREDGIKRAFGDNDVLYPPNEEERRRGIAVVVKHRSKVGHSHGAW